MTDILRFIYIKNQLRKVGFFYSIHQNFVLIGRKEKLLFNKPYIIKSVFRVEKFNVINSAFQIRNVDFLTQ